MLTFLAWFMVLKGMKAIDVVKTFGTYLNDPEAVRRSGAKYLLVHKRLAAEAAQLGYELPPVRSYAIDAVDPVWRDAFGEPVHEDRWLRVYSVRGD